MRKARGQNWEVEIAARAWENLGVVPGDVFRAVQRELEVVAERLSGEGLNDSAPGQPVLITDGEFQAEYVLDLDSQLVVLQSVSRKTAKRSGAKTRKKP